MSSLSAAVARGAARAGDEPDGGAALVVQHTTQGMQFGIDAFSCVAAARARSDDRKPRWELGPRFEGLRGVGAGLHLLSFAPRGDGAGREGVFVACAAGDVLLKAWDAANERAGGVSVSFRLYITQP